MKDRRELYLADDDHLRIRLLSVSVDSIPKGGGRAAFELSTMHEHQAALVLTVEARRSSVPRLRGGSPSASTPRSRPRQRHGCARICRR